MNDSQHTHDSHLGAAVPKSLTSADPVVFLL